MTGLPSTSGMPSATPAAPPPTPRRGGVGPTLARLSRLFRPGAFPGPVFTKEIRVSGRRAGIYWIRGLSALALFGLAGLVYLATFESWGGSAASLQNLQTVAPAVTIAIMWFQFIVMTLVAAASAAPMICDEKRSGSLAALLTTPLTAPQILLGKVGAMLANLIVLAMIPLPLLLAARMFGGTSGEVIAAAASLTFSSALLGAMLGLYHSAGSSRATGAAGKAMAAWALLQFGVPLLILAINSYTFIRIPDVWAARTSGPIALIAVQWLLVGGPGPFAAAASELWISATLWMLALSALLFVGASIRLRRVMSDDASPALTPATQPTPPALGQTPGQTPGQAPAAKAPPTRALSRVVSDNPVTWREVRQRSFRGRFSRWFLLVVLPVGGLLLATLGFVDADEYFYASVAILSFATMLLAAIGAASGLTGEKESRTLDVLLATPLSARDIILGKVLGAARRVMLLPLIASVAIGLIGVISGRASPLLTLHLLLMYSGVVFAASGTGMVFSVLCRRTAVAMALNLGLCLAAWAFLPVLILILLAISSGPGAESVMSVVGLTNPIAMPMLAANGAVDSDGFLSGRYNLFDFGDVGPIGFTVVSFFFGLAYATVGLFAMALASSLLAEHSGRRS